ncbi:hypothetical protein JW916_09610 [Candidatus Sumerlaeota bacterium]|nr:hypothetical protein [Candidatus Sumerlaeota bacterium]
MTRGNERSSSARSASDRSRRLLASEWAGGALVVVALFLCIAVASWRNRHLPFYWDAGGYVYPHAREIYDANLYPILRNWDVGHPTGYFFALAVMMKLFGVGPFAGHLLNWGFTALLIAATYGLCRALSLERLVSALCAGTAMAFPLVCSSSQQIASDLALAASVLAALWFFVRRRYGWYVVFASFAVLCKFHGFLATLGPLAALPFCGVRSEKEGARTGRIRESLWILSPVVVLGLFLVVRFAVRGPGMTLRWKATQRVYLLGDPAGYAEGFGEAIRNLFVVPRLHYPLIVLAALAVGLCVKRFFPRVMDPAGRTLFGSETERHAFWVLLWFGIFYNAALLPLTNLLPRYSLPTVSVAFVFLAWGGRKLAGRVYPVAIVLSLLIAVYALQCYPPNVARLPAPLSRWLSPGPIPASYYSECDLRFVDIVDCAMWAARRIHDDIDRRGLPPTTGIATQWPFSDAMHDAPLGYVDREAPSVHVDNWSEVNPDLYPYVLIVEPITSLDPEPPEGLFTGRLVAEMRKGEAKAIVWYVERKSGD